MADRIGRSTCRGLSLVELVVTLAISSILLAMVVTSLVGLDRDRVQRELAARVQGEARDALAAMAADLSRASLGTLTGVVFTSVGGNRERRPAVQIVDDVPGGGMLDVKPSTDALLVVGAVLDRQTVTLGDHWESTAPLNVTALNGLVEGDHLLVGEYEQASWLEITAITGTQLTVSPTDANIFPGVQATKLTAGSPVRSATARLWFVNGADELVRVELDVPRPPMNMGHVVGREVMARGVENLQLDCEVQQANALAPCPAELAAAHALSQDAEAAFGTFVAGRGPRLDLDQISNLRTVSISLLARSPNPLAELHGNAKVTLDGKTLPVGGGLPDGGEYVRRAYQLTVAVKNTSLGVL